MSTYIIESEAIINGYKKDTILEISNNNQLLFILKDYNTKILISEAKGLSPNEVLLLVEKFQIVVPEDFLIRLNKDELDKVVLYRKDGTVDETTWKYEEPNPFWLMVYDAYHHNYLQGLKDNGVSFVASKGVFTLSFSKKSKIKPNSIIDNSIILLLRLYLNYIDNDIKNIPVNVNTFLNFFEKTEYTNGGVQYLLNIEKFKESNK